MKKKICFRADAGVQTGYGHFIRTLALADMLKDDFDCVFYTVDPSPYQLQELQKVCPCVTLKAETRLEDFLDCLEGTETVVLDNYFYTSDYQQAIKARGCRLVCIDDMHDRHYYADIVINHAYGSRLKDYSTEPYTQVCLGLPYALLRKPFLENRPVARRDHILINYGGSDIYNLTCKVLAALSDELKPFTVDVITGDAFAAKEELAALQRSNPAIVLHKGISAEQMCSLMQSARIAFLPASTVLWEAVFCGCKIIYGHYVDNQTDICRNVGSSRALGMRCVGDLRNVSSEALASAFTEELENPERPGFVKPDVRGSFIRLFHQPVTVRKATEDDVHLYFEWANDPAVRQMAFHSDHITWENHCRWFNKKVSAPDSLLLLCYQQEQPVGQVRFDLTEQGEAEIDISIAKEHRGKGLGRAMLDAAVDYTRNMKGYTTFVSAVKTENPASQRMFLATGFRQKDITDGVCHFVRTENANSINNMEEKILAIINSIRMAKGLTALDRLDRNASLREDLNLTSFDLAELTVKIEDEFDIDIFEDGLVAQVGEIFDKLSA